MKNYYPWLGVCLSFIFILGMLGTIMDRALFDSYGMLLLYLLISYLLMIVIWFANFWVILRVGETLVAKYFTALLIAISVSLLINTFSPIPDYFYGDKYEKTPWMSMLHKALKGVFPASFYFGIQYFLLQYRQTRKMEIELYKHEQENAQWKLNNLHQYLSPDFLFESINAIQKNTDDSWTVKTLEKLKIVYRHLMNYNKDNVFISLAEEILFINNYLELFKEKYAQALELHINLGDSANKSEYIPYFSLQLLVENILKHNAITFQNPLTIKLERVDDCIVVSNNLQTKIYSNFSSDKRKSYGLKSLQDIYMICYLKSN